MSKPKIIGKVTHYYDKIAVAIVKLKKPLQAGQAVRFGGKDREFTQTIGEMQYDHKAIEKAKSGQEVGVKVEQKVRENDEVFLEEGEE